MAKVTPLTEEQKQYKDEIEKLAKRMLFALRDVEVEALDMAMYSNAYALGGMSKTAIVKVANTIEGFENEFKRIKNKWIELHELGK